MIFYLNLVEVFLSILILIVLIYYNIINSRYRQKKCRIFSMLCGIILPMFIIAEIRWILNYEELMTKLDDYLWILSEIGMQVALLYAMILISLGGKNEIRNNKFFSIASL